MKGQELDGAILEKFKVKKTLMDFMNTTYKPEPPEYKNNVKISESDNVVAEEYVNLVFFITKIRHIFEAFRFSFEELNLEDTNFPKTPKTISLFLDQNIPEKIKPFIRKIFNFKHYKLFRSVSEIPQHTEFHYLGELDTVFIKENLKSFDVMFKTYVGELLKFLLNPKPVEEESSLVVSE